MLSSVMAGNHMEIACVFGAAESKKSGKHLTLLWLGCVHLFMCYTTSSEVQLYMLISHSHSPLMVAVAMD